MADSARSKKATSLRSACDKCHQVKTRCYREIGAIECGRCARLNLSCSYSASLRMGRPKGNGNRLRSASSSAQSPQPQRSTEDRVQDGNGKEDRHPISPDSTPSLDRQDPFSRHSDSHWSQQGCSPPRNSNILLTSFSNPVTATLQRETRPTPSSEVNPDMFQDVFRSDTHMGNITEHIDSTVSMRHDMSVSDPYPVRSSSILQTPGSFLDSFLNADSASFRTTDHDNSRDQDQLYSPPQEASQPPGSDGDIFMGRASAERQARRSARREVPQAENLEPNDYEDAMYHLSLLHLDLYRLGSDQEHSSNPAGSMDEILGATETFSDIIRRLTRAAPRGDGTVPRTGQLASVNGMAGLRATPPNENADIADAARHPDVATAFLVQACYLRLLQVYIAVLAHVLHTLQITTKITQDFPETSSRPRSQPLAKSQSLLSISLGSFSLPGCSNLNAGLLTILTGQMLRHLQKVASHFLSYDSGSSGHLEGLNWEKSSPNAMTPVSSGSIFSSTISSLDSGPQKIREREAAVATMLREISQVLDLGIER